MASGFAICTGQRNARTSPQPEAAEAPVDDGSMFPSVRLNGKRQAGRPRADHRADLEIQGLFAQAEKPEILGQEGLSLGSSTESRPPSGATPE